MSPLGDFPYLACYHPSENIPSSQDINQLGFKESFMVGRNLPFAHAFAHSPSCLRAPMFHNLTFFFGEGQDETLIYFCV